MKRKNKRISNSVKNSLSCINESVYKVIDWRYESPIFVETSNERIAFGDYYLYIGDYSISIELQCDRQKNITGRKYKKIVKSNQEWHHRSGLQGIYNNNIEFDTELGKDLIRELKLKDLGI